MSRVGFLTDDGKVFLQRCPKCHLENWGCAVASGQCAWCGYKATPKDIKDKE